MLLKFDWRESYEANANVSHKTLVLDDGNLSLNIFSLTFSSFFQFSGINKFVTAVGLEAVITFDYLGYFDLSGENALEVILALHFFQMRNEMKQCTDFTLNNQELLTINNALEFRSCFNMLDLGLGSEYSEKIDKFIKVCYFLFRKFKNLYYIYLCVICLKFNE